MEDWCILGSSGSSITPSCLEEASGVHEKTIATRFDSHYGIFQSIYSGGVQCGTADLERNQCHLIIYRANNLWRLRNGSRKLPRLGESKPLDPGCSKRGRSRIFAQHNTLSSPWLMAQYWLGWRKMAPRWIVQKLTCRVFGMQLIPSKGWLLINRWRVV